MIRRATAPVRALEPTPEITRLQGGLDQLTPKFDRDPGLAVSAVNFECALNGGYSRVEGYERFDGRLAVPSAATYSIVQVESFTNMPSVGQTLTGDVTGTTGKIIALGANYIVLTLIDGAGFSTSEDVSVGATPIGTAELQTATISALLDAQYKNAAADVYRALITGAGSYVLPILGVVSMNRHGIHSVYAFVDHTIFIRILKATPAGWTVVPFDNYEVSFAQGGFVEPNEGDIFDNPSILTVDGKARIRRVITESGSWESGTAAGRFIIDVLQSEIRPGSVTLNAITFNLTSFATQIQFVNGGKFEFDIGNFSGQESTRRIYGCDGVNRGFEFDGELLVPISTGFQTDAPKHVKIFQNQLFFSFESSFGNSVPGFPYRWVGEEGAAEHTTGNEVTGFEILPGEQSAPALIVGCRDQNKILYGATAIPGIDAPLFQLVDFNAQVGSYARSIKTIDRVYMLDDRGVLNFEAAQEFGNFQQACITQNIQSFIENRRARFTCSSVNKDKGQYRLFFSDGSALYITFKAGKLVGMMPMLFPHPIVCVWNGEDANGSDVTYAGSTNGVVYQLDRGTSFDGQAIEASFTLSWNFLKLVRWLKTFKKAILELRTSSYVAFTLEYALGYGSPDIDQPDGVAGTSAPVGGFTWDAFTWDAFTWDGQTDIPVEIDLDGNGENIQYTLKSGTDYVGAYTIPSITTLFHKRRLLR